VPLRICRTWTAQANRGHEALPRAVPHADVRVLLQGGSPIGKALFSTHFVSAQNPCPTVPTAAEGSPRHQKAPRREDPAA